QPSGGVPSVAQGGESRFGPAAGERVDGSDASGDARVGGAGDDAAELRGGGGGGGARSAGTAGVWEAAGEVLVSVAAGVRHARRGGGALLSGGDPALREH